MQSYLLHYGGKGTGQGPICYGNRDSNGNNKTNKQVPKKVGNKKIKQSYIDKGAFTIDKSDLEEIHQEIRRRDTLDYVEDDEEEESDQVRNDDDGDESNVQI